MKTKLLVSAFLLCMIFPTIIYSQGRNVIEYVDETSITLTEKQEHLLQTIRERPQSKAVY